MKVGLRLLDDDRGSPVVLQRDKLPLGAGVASLLSYKGSYYHYTRIVAERDSDAAFAEFTKCAPPFAVPEEE